MTPASLDHRGETAHQHAVRRARERYQLELAASDLRTIANAVHLGKGSFLCEQDDTRSIYEVEYQGEQLVVVYDSTRQSIRTFLPERGSMPEADYVARIAEFYSPKE